MANTKRATDSLNLAISTISGAAGALKAIIEGMPDSEAKRGLLVLEKEIDKGVSAAFAALREIRQAAESI